jgi:hypothetical protein
MPTLQLTEDELRVLAYMRAYVDHREQHLDPEWVRRQLNLTSSQMQQAARGLASRKLVEIVEFDLMMEALARKADVSNEPYLTDICLTESGWEFLTRGR